MQQTVTRPKKILYVEDESLFHHLYGEKLKAAGHQVVVSVNGEEAMAELDRGSFDLVVTDLVMPNMSGFELMKRLHERKEKTIVLTGLVGNVDREEAKERGALHYLDKGVTSPQEFVKIVESV